MSSKFKKITCKEYKVLPEIEQADKEGWEPVCAYVGKRDYEILFKKKTTVRKKTA